MKFWQINLLLTNFGKSLSFSSCLLALHKKGSFLLRISLVNVIKSVGNCGFGHIY